jgi:hypothetical protein
MRKRFILKCAFVLCALYILDVTVGIFAGKYLKSITNNGSPLAIDKYVFFESQSDIVLMGASHVKHGYDPRIISEKTGLSCYNAAQDGIDVIQNYIYLKSIINRTDPQVIVLDVYYRYLDGSMKYRLSNLNIWYKTNKEVSDYFDFDTDRLNKIKLKSNLYVYNGLLYQIIRTSVRSEVNYDGYSPLYGEYDGDFSYSNEFNPDIEEFSYLERIVSLCNEHNIQLIFARAPSFSHNKEYDKWINDFCHNRDILLLDHIDDKSYLLNKKLFHNDGSHLNNEGAKLFSESIAIEIIDSINRLE